MNRASPDLSPQRLAHILGTGPISAVKAVPAGELGLLSTITRIEIEYWAEEGSGPTSVILKRQGSDPDLAALSNRLRMPQREIGAYRHLRHLTDLLSARCYHSELSADGSRYELWLEDLGPSILPTQRAGVDESTMREAVSLLARLHARTWSPSPSDFSWCPSLGDPIFTDMAAHLTLDWPTFADRYAGRLPDRAMEVAERFAFSMDTERDRMQREQATCFLHGDARADNLASDGHGDVRLIDWQLCMVGPAAFDLAHLICGSLSIEDRRGQLSALLDAYIATLGEIGVDYPRERLDVDLGRSLLLVLPLNVHFAIGPSAGEEADASRIEVLTRYFSAIDEYTVA